MPLQKQSININFSNGLDTKTDPWQVQVGKFLSLSNSIFDKGGMLQKRNGFSELTSLPNSSSVNLTTFDGNLIAVGSSLQVLTQDNEEWINKGSIQNVTLSTFPLVRSAYGLTTVDTAVAENKLCCTVYTDSQSNCYYQISDSETGEIIIYQTALPATSTNPRVFVLGNFFIITFLATVSASPHLQYISIPLNMLSSPSSATDISTTVKDLSAGYDGCITNNTLYIAYNASDIGGAVRVTYIDSTLAQHGTAIISSHSSNLMSVTFDSTSMNPIIWVTFWNSSNNNGYTAVFDQQLTSILSATLTINNINIHNLTSNAVSGTLYLFYETIATYSFSSTPSHYVSSVTCSQTGTVGSPQGVKRSVGLASKSFYLSSTKTIYFLSIYNGSYQPSYFLIDQNGNVVAKLAYSNAFSYSTNQILPQANVSSNLVQMGYLYKDQIVPVNKSQGVSQIAGIYSQAGINLVDFTFNPNSIPSSEIGNNLNLVGGILWAYDGSKPVEQNFNLWPEDIGTSTSTSGGNLSAQQYYYYVTYEWTDAQGNIHRSAPSIPMGITTTGATSSNTLNIPTLRITYKSNVRVVIYRWSTAQQIPYQITSIASPLLNDPTVDSVQYVDTVADADILGNVILYTTGGVVENIGPPACTTQTLFKSRLVLVDAEDQNLLWYSKQVIEATPVEMSDLFTLYIAPTISAQGSTGPITALSALDDKLIIFKKDAIYYMVGTGPDNTGENNDFSDPVFITSTVGCNNQESIVFMPQGLIFQSEKGIWLLGRDLSTVYIGSPVEAYTSSTVKSAINIPSTNQVRFTLESGITLMYDYFYNQWGTFTNIPAVSSVIYQGLHTYLDSSGKVFQETSGVYLDGSNPVLMSFTTSWINLNGLQNYQRAYFFYLLGKYFSPHFLNVQVAYDYNPYPTQTTLIKPANYNPNFGSDSLYGSSNPYGGNSFVEEWRVFLQNQKCESFQISINEVYDSSLGVEPGAGLTLSGIDLVIGIKSGYPRLPASQYAG